ncbi:hypothetical protein CBER1_10611 [Cercospora berteroae]|uniref:Major facilitator superfamily (MFS) profile domain-containing protein n=1 Tax=Cercospora berteroae TaxID=357750 RepID=A0A2S6CJ27_9PEZI|nr:hypothetical protein CBER1_10611 [Cercospora berteroae]
MEQADRIALDEMQANRQIGPGQRKPTEYLETTDIERNDAFLVTFSSGDPADPKTWSTKTKWAATFALSIQGFNRIMISTIMAPAIPTIAVDLRMSNIESTMALSVYVLATAFGPLVIGPLSEALLIAARLLAGFGASAVYTVAYGVLADIWPNEQRGRSLSLYLLIPLTGAAIGPIVGGYIVEYSTWRWMFWATTIFQAAAEIVTLPIIHETYAPLLLQRHAAKLRNETGDSRYHTETEIRSQGHSTFKILSNSLTRPLRLLAFHPTIQVQALLGGINYGLLYFALASFSNLIVSNYGQSVSISGLHYISLAIGEIAGAQLCGPLVDYLYCTLTRRAGNRAAPELRVPLLLPSVIITPVGFLVYGWAAQYRLHWAVVDVGAALLAMGMQVFNTTLRAYVMDADPEHVSSASAATQFLSSMLAFAFPLFAEDMYAALGYGWGNSLLAFLSIGIALPSTGILWKYGARLRAKKDSSY